MGQKESFNANNGALFTAIEQRKLLVAHLIMRPTTGSERGTVVLFFRCSILTEDLNQQKFRQGESSLRQ